MFTSTEQRSQEIITFSADDRVAVAMVRPRNAHYAVFTLHTGDMLYDVGMYTGTGKAAYMRVSIDMPTDMRPAEPADGLWSDPTVRKEWATWRRKVNTAKKQWAWRALHTLGITGPLQWNPKADCSCGCSPAFVWRDGSMYVGAQRVQRLTIAPAGTL